MIFEDQRLTYAELNARGQSSLPIVCARWAQVRNRLSAFVSTDRRIVVVAHPRRAEMRRSLPPA